jgi:PAS domain S-box-containing protein
MLGEFLISKTRFRFYSWPTLAVILLATQAVLSVTLKQGSTLNGYCEISYLLLLILATGVAAANAVQSTQSIRLFWLCLAAAFGVWALVPFAFFYNLVLQGKSPAFLVHTPLIFLHVLLMIAAVAFRPHLKLPSRRPYRTTLNFLTLCFFLFFAFTYLFPYEYVPHSAHAIFNFEVFYFVENLLLIFILGLLVIRSQPPWKSIYRHLFGASVLYALGSLVNNIFWGLRDPSGDLTSIPAARGLLGLFFTASISWFVWVGLEGRRHALKLAETTQVETRDSRRVTLLAMLAVVGIPLTGIWELFRADEPYATRVTRLLIVLITAMFLAVMAFIQAYLSDRELASDVGAVNDRLLLAMESGKVVGWEWDFETARDSWFGDLQSMFGIPSEKFVGSPEDFDRYVYPQDRQQISEALADAKTNRKPYAVEFRVVWPDGTVRWVAATGKFHYSANGAPKRMLGMAQDITERKRAEKERRESEERFRLVADTAPVLIWMSSNDKLCTFFNQGWLKFTGRSMEQELGQGWTAGVHPEDLAHCLGIYSANFQARADFEREYRLRRFDGQYRWIVDYGVPRFESDGTFCGYLGSCVDITERKLSAESLHTLTGRLIHAQEEERTRIARELHDDFSQRLALLGISLGHLWKMLPSSDVEGRARVEEMLNGTKELSSDLHSLSHQLHSSRLEHVGLAAAVAGLCKEFSNKYKIEFHFRVCDLRMTVPKDVALCLFRVAQEALGNVVKHSQAAHATVEVGANAGGVSLRIKDDGHGFDTERSNPNAGIGLLGMHERIRLVGGRLLVTSELMRGTEILVEVPLHASKAQAQVQLK